MGDGVSDLASKLASKHAPQKQWDEELKYEMVRNAVNVNNSVKWSWFKVPVKVKQINENLF